MLKCVCCGEELWPWIEKPPVVARRASIGAAVALAATICTFTSSPKPTTIASAWSFTSIPF
jgi:hypothetical protein